MIGFCQRTKNYGRALFDDIVISRSTWPIAGDTSVTNRRARLDANRVVNVCLSMGVF
jgi:hypothetical protein